jgi:hypothetical protein
MSFESSEAFVDSESEQSCRDLHSFLAALHRNSFNESTRAAKFFSVRLFLQIDSVS